MKTLAILSTAAVAAALIHGTASAYEFRVRFVERDGTSEVALPGNTIDASSGAPRRIRIQFGVFDDAAGPAAAGGFVGWNVGTLAVSGPENNSDETRTPGRLAPFNFAPDDSGNGMPPLPSGDPFTMLTQIDNTLGAQGTEWPVGAPAPNPAVIRGFNTFVSTYEFTIDPVGLLNYTVTLTGNVFAATDWRGGATPPSDSDGDGIDDTPGGAAWVPFTTAPRPITATLSVFTVPAPSAAPLLGGLVLVAVRRRR